MAIYKNITSATTEDLIKKDGDVGGKIGKMTIANYSDDNPVTIDVFLEDNAASESTDASNNKYHFVNKVVIPVGASLVLTDNLSFNKSLYYLRLTTVGTSPLVSVIIK